MRKTPVSPLNAFKGIVNVKADFDDLVAFASDPYAYPEYIYLCTSAEVLKFQNENDTYLHSVNKGHKIARTRAIPLVVDRNTLDQAVHVAKSHFPIFSVRPV